MTTDEEDDFNWGDLYEAALARLLAADQAGAAAQELASRKRLIRFMRDKLEAVGGGDSETRGALLAAAAEALGDALERP